MNQMDYLSPDSSTTTTTERNRSASTLCSSSWTIKINTPEEEDEKSLTTLPVKVPQTRSRIRSAGSLLDINVPSRSVKSNTSSRKKNGPDGVRSFADEFNAHAKRSRDNKTISKSTLIGLIANCLIAALVIGVSFLVLIALGWIVYYQTTGQLTTYSGTYSVNNNFKLKNDKLELHESDLEIVISDRPKSIKVIENGSQSTTFIRFNPGGSMEINGNVTVPKTLEVGNLEGNLNKYAFQEVFTDGTTTTTVPATYVKINMPAGTVSSSTSHFDVSTANQIQYIDTKTRSAVVTYSLTMYNNNNPVAIACGIIKNENTATIFGGNFFVSDNVTLSYGIVNGRTKIVMNQNDYFEVWCKNLSGSEDMDTKAFQMDIVVL